MIRFNDYCLRQFGQKVYKLSLNGGMTCPNRDGTLSSRGCIFCSAGGSGDFAPSAMLPIEQQIEQAKARVSAKFKGDKFIAYFQAYTNTYAPVEYLEQIFTAVINREDIAALSIATRPDCLGEDVLQLLKKLNHIKPVWVELGLQTIHPKTAELIGRGYPLAVYDEAVKQLKKLGIHTVVHVILGLPGETEEMMLQTVDYVSRSGAEGIKLQLLHVLEGTELAQMWRQGKVPIMELEEYAELVARCVSRLPENMVLHRFTGDGPKRLLLAPLWSGDKKRVLNTINSKLNKLKK